MQRSKKLCTKSRRAFVKQARFSEKKDSVLHAPAAEANYRRLISSGFALRRIIL